MSFSILWSCLGLVLLAATLCDFYTTTMTLRGGGPMSNYLSQRLWRGCLRLHRAVGAEKLLSLAGPAILLLMILVWFALCWLGWLLIFCGAEQSVVNAQTLVPASWGERLYYAGYTLTTVGYGDFKAATPLAQLASVVAGFNGLFLLTLAITYSIPILSATAARRQISIQINILGRSTEEIVDKYYEGGSFAFLAAQLQQFNNQIVAVSQQHLAYPVLHYFHDTRRSHALPLNIVSLHEACTVILFAFPDIPYATRAQLENTQKVIDSFLENVRPDLLRRQTTIPTAPSCQWLSVMRYAAKTVAEIQEHMGAQPQRQLLLSLIQNDGWQWRDVHPVDVA